MLMNPDPNRIHIRQLRPSVYIFLGYFTDFPMFIYAPVGNQLCRAESLFGRRGLWEAPFCKFNSVPRYLPSVKVHVPVFEL